MEAFGFGFTTIVSVIVVIYLLSSIKILAEYERGVIFRLGRLLSTAKGPGIALVFAPVDRIVRVSLRQEALEVPPQDIITRDNVTLKVNAVIFLRVIDPNKAVVEVSNYVYQTSQFAQTTLRSVLGEQELDELLSHREKINLRLQSILDTHTSPWGVKVTNVEVKQVDMPESMLRAMAKQAEAEREKRSKIIHAEGEFSAAQRLVDAAHLLATEPVSVQLRYLQTLTEIGVEKNTTVIFPVPVDFFSGLQKLLGSGDSSRKKDSVERQPGKTRAANCREWNHGFVTRHGNYTGNRQAAVPVLRIGWRLRALFRAGVFARTEGGTGDHHGECGHYTAGGARYEQDERRFRGRAADELLQGGGAERCQSSVDSAGGRENGHGDCGPCRPANATPAQAPATDNTPDAPPITLPTAEYFVQVAAVSKQEDADSLVDALKKKEYPAFVAAASPDRQTVSRAGGAVLRGQRRGGHAHAADCGWV